MKYDYRSLYELGKIVTGKTPPTSENDNFDGEYPFITPTDISTYEKRYLFNTERTISEIGKRKLKSNLLPENSICVVCIGSTIGKICMTDRPSFTNQQINSLIPNENYDPFYLYYILRSLKSYFQLIGGGTGSGKGIVNKNVFSKTKVKVLIDKKNQLKVSNILKKYDDLIENNEKRISILENIIKDTYQEWFVKYRFPGYENIEFENGLPKKWKYEKLKKVSDVVYGYSFNSDLFTEIETEIPVVRIRDIPSGETKTYTTEQCDKKYLINDDDIIIGMDGIFHMCIWKDGNAYLNQRNLIIKNGKYNLSQVYLYHSLFPQIKYWEQVISGTTVAHLGEKHIKRISIVIPEESIVKKFNIFSQPFVNEIKFLWKQNQNLKVQRESLINKLLTDKLIIE